jgi:glycosyltransferase involved in cell wall biosynthesis
VRLLHVGSGFRPWRRGGLVAYVEDVMAEQVRRGHEVTYLFAGRQEPFRTRPRLRRWRSGGVRMLEIVNSPLYDHGRQPQLEDREPRVEAIVAATLAEVRPDVVHVQELAGLPFSVLDAIGRAGVPHVVTLQDYFPLCSTFRLLDSTGAVCLRREIGADCMASVAADQRRPGLLIEATLLHALRRVPALPGIDRERWARRIARRAVAHRRRRLPHPPPAPADFQRRRERNVERLSNADAVLAMSHRVEEIYAQLGVEPARLRTVHLTLAHVERLRPRRFVPAARPLTFATLAALESESKGARVVLDALARLAGDARAGRVRLLVFGHSDARLAAEAARVPGIELRGAYRPDQLDALLDEVDVGLMPSVWEEAYGFAGLEMLAKGIPVIANAIGGMPDYVREGETGWLNRSRSGEELAAIMARLIADPSLVAARNEHLIAAREQIVKPLARHADELEAIYAEVSAAVPARS